MILTRKMAQIFISFFLLLPNAPFFFILFQTFFVYLLGCIKGVLEGNGPGEDVVRSLR